MDIFHIEDVYSQRISTFLTEYVFSHGTYTFSRNMYLLRELYFFLQRVYLMYIFQKVYISAENVCFFLEMYTSLRMEDSIFTPEKSVSNIFLLKISLLLNT
jgi:hypothetical protein